VNGTSAALGFPIALANVTGLGHHFGLGFVDGLGAQPSPMVRRLTELNDALSQRVKQR